MSAARTAVKSKSRKARSHGGASLGVGLSGPWTSPLSGPLTVEYRAVGDLLTYARNARTHSDAQVAEIASSIRAFGFANPVLVGEDGVLIAGHGRLAAAKLMGLAEVPVIVLRGLTEAQRRALVLADNRIALNAGWDADMLRLELRDLADLAVDLKSLGFSKAELATALRGEASEGLTDEDEAPEPTERPVARPGDIWGLGEHRIACGDCTDPELVAALLDGRVPNLMVTDPPYGVEYDPEWRHRLGVNESKRTGKVLNDGRADWREAWGLFPGEIAYVWHGALHAATVAESLIFSGFSIRAQIVWAKPRLVIGRGDYHWQHEPAWYAVRQKGNWTGDRKQTTLWTIESKGQDTDTIHGTQKPVECMRRPMLNNSAKGDLVYDPFLGSGTTLIAAETVGRVCLGLELNPAYVDVIIRRWQAFTGRKAILIRDGDNTDDAVAGRIHDDASRTQPGAPIGISFDEVARVRNGSASDQKSNLIEPDRSASDTRETSQQKTPDQNILPDGV